MIYITAMQVFSRRFGRGVNIFLHKKAAPIDPLKWWSVIDDPGSSIDAASSVQVKPGGNSVECSMDFVFEDERTWRVAIKAGLDALAQAVEAGKRSPILLPVQPPKVYAAMFMNLGLQDLETKRSLYRQLREALERWEEAKKEEIEAGLQAPAAAE